jgi:MarR family transcriptional regulator, transcriptional regulator for hemolysin
MLQYDFDQSIGYWITFTSNRYQQAVKEELAPYGITFRQVQVLCWLVLEGPIPQVVLAEKMIVEPPTLVRILDRMERDGWVRREPDPDDRRCKVIVVQPKAKPVWSKMVTCLRNVRKKATAGMSDEEVRTLQKLLNQVQENLTVDSCVNQSANC